jgi:DNA processing protein
VSFPLSEQRYWLGFSLIPKIGPKRLLRLQQHFGELSIAWAAPPSALTNAGVTGQALTNLLQHRKSIDLDAEMANIRRANVHILTLGDKNYPELLRTLDDAPPVLYVRGSLVEADSHALSIVGTRKATRYGRDVTFDLARQLAQQEITIISGLANGIDSAAHRGAIEGGGRTIAVLGCGVDVVYPRNNHDLAQEVIAHGAIVSEFPIGTKPIAANFPRRNRIISGLALGVLITEAPEQSGALITAHCAADQGREVFAVPANIFNTMGRGANRLIQDGAKLVMGVQDVLDELNIAHDVVQTRTVAERIRPANEAERRLLQHLDVDPIHIDDLTRLSGLPIEEVTSTLTILELKGVAQMVGQMQYSRVLKSK